MTIVAVLGFSLETKLIRVSKTFESKKSSEIKQVQDLIRDRGLENKTFTLDALHVFSKNKLDKKSE
jgi:hypothetical protein